LRQRARTRRNRTAARLDNKPASCSIPAFDGKQLPESNEPQASYQTQTIEFTRLACRELVEGRRLSSRNPGEG
jgi:hypothetical protein